MEESLEHKIKSPKVKQPVIKDFFKSPLKLSDYKIVTTKWLNAKDSHSPRSTQSTTVRSRSERKSRDKSKSKINVKSLQIKGSKAPLDKWIVKDYEDIKHSRKIMKCSSQIDEKSSSKHDISNNKLLLSKNDSFEKYGMALPTVDEILENMKEMKSEAATLDDFENLYGAADITIPNTLKTLLEVDNSPLETTKHELLDCKYLSPALLETYFKEHMDHMRDVFNEVVYLERHEMYKNTTLRSKLIYNTSTLVFNQDQRGHLVKLLELEFDPESKNTEYLFKVLLPELCLRIFMSAYGMTLEEAVDYLDWRPAD